MKRKDKHPYQLGLTDNPDGSGQFEPIAKFMTNPAGAAIVNTTGPIRQVVNVDTTGGQRRTLAIVATDAPTKPVQVQAR